MPRGYWITRAIPFTHQRQLAHLCPAPVFPAPSEVRASSCCQPPLPPHPGNFTWNVLHTWEHGWDFQPMRSLYLVVLEVLSWRFGVTGFWTWGKRQWITTISFSRSRLPMLENVKLAVYCGRSFSESWCWSNLPNFVLLPTNQVWRKEIRLRSKELDFFF